MQGGRKLTEVRPDSEGAGAISTTPPTIGDLADEAGTFPLSLLLFARSFTSGLDQAYLVMRWVCGMVSGSWASSSPTRSLPVGRVGTGTRYRRNVGLAAGNGRRNRKIRRLG